MPKKNKNVLNILFEVKKSRNKTNDKIEQSNTLLDNNINNTLLKKYRNNSSKIRNKKTDNIKKNNIISINKNLNIYKKNKNNNESFLIYKSNNKTKKTKNRNEYITINNNYYTIINNTTVNNINEIKNNLNDIKYDNINDIVNTNKKINSSLYVDKNNENTSKHDENINHNKFRIKNGKTKKKKNGVHKLSFWDKVIDKNASHSIKKEKIPNNFIHNILFNTKIKDKNQTNKSIPSTYREYVSINFNNNPKSRNHPSLNKQFNTNNNINNLTLFKEKKINYLNNTISSEQKSFNKQKYNLRTINRKENIDLNSKKINITTKNKNGNNDNNQLSLKKKIHLFHQMKEELIKQYSNKNKILKDCIIDADKNLL